MKDKRMLRYIYGTEVLPEDRSRVLTGAFSHLVNYSLGRATLTDAGLVKYSAPFYTILAVKGRRLVQKMKDSRLSSLTNEEMDKLFAE